MCTLPHEKKPFSDCVMLPIFKPHADKILPSRELWTQSTQHRNLTAIKLKSNCH